MPMLRDDTSAMSLRHVISPASAMLLVAMLTGTARAETAVKFSLDSPFEGPAAPFLLPLDKGYYKAEGLDVSFDSAVGPLEPIKRLASGAYDMAVGDINALIKYRDANPGTPIKSVFIVYNRPPFAVIGRKSRGVTAPKDLEGKKLGAPAADASFAQWPIFAQVNGIDVTKVAIENVSIPVREPMVAAGQVDAITGYSFSSFVNLKDRGVPAGDITVLLMADYGVRLYGDAIMVSPKFASEHPDAVKGFLRAFVKGLRETVKSPAAAVGSVFKRNDNAKKGVELERLKMAIRDNIVTPEVKTNGYGGIDSTRFDRAVDQIALTYKFKAGKPKPDDIFDASYLPPAASRKAN
jgi:NitT/TauT family transport system substrate-binding protein